MQTILLMRHGYPVNWDLKLKNRGSPAHLRLDSTLADIGVQQATHTAAHLATKGVDAVLSSPFRRCLETADLIAAACNTTVSPDWKLSEVLLSTVLGTPFSPGSAMDPDWEDRRKGAGKPSHPESDRSIQERVMKTVVELKARKPHAQRVVIVSHEIILKALMNAMTGRSVALDWHCCALTTLTRATAVDRQWRIVGAPGDVTHLGALDRVEPTEEIVHRYHPLDSRS